MNEIINDGRLWFFPENINNSFDFYLKTPMTSSIFTWKHQWRHQFLPENIDDGFSNFRFVRGREEPEVEDVAQEGTVDQDPKRVQCDSAEEESGTIQ
jgi:hypothetical protein